VILSAGACSVTPCAVCVDPLTLDSNRSPRGPISATRGGAVAPVTPTNAEGKPLAILTRGGPGTDGQPVETADARPASVADDARVVEPAYREPEADELAERSEQRAARAHEHAVMARREAERDAARGDRASERLHLREASVHERAAELQKATAALYRRQARRGGWK
jgi:hypothetical protein